MLIHQHASVSKKARIATTRRSEEREICTGHAHLVAFPTLTLSSLPHSRVLRSDVSWLFLRSRPHFIYVCVTMIISYRGLLAAAELMLFMAGQVDGHHWNQRQVQSSISTSSSPPPPQPTPTFFETEWVGLEASNQITLDTDFRVAYTISGNVSSNVQQQAAAKQLFLVLMWTSATGPDSPNSANTWEVIDIEYVCNNSNDGVCLWSNGDTGDAKFNFAVNPSSLTSWTQNPGKFFLCFVTNTTTIINTHYCESYSPFFDIVPPSPSENRGVNARANAIEARDLPSFTNTLPVTQTTLIVTSSGSAPSATAPPGAVAPISYTTIDGHTYPVSMITTSAPLSTVTSSPTTTNAPTSSPASVSSKSKGGLPTGAIAGIAIGGFIIILLALLVGFFCYRRSRRRSTQGTPEQVLLTHNIHNGSRDLIGEKMESEGPMLGSILETRPSLSPFSHLSTSAPYNGPVGPGRLSPLPQQSLIPQRHPTSATVNTMHTEVSNISRGLSDASGPMSSRSTVRGDFEEPYHDVPIYGDARHVPQIYQGTLQAPFLSEPGMTDEELTRLEEEERRIDAAILEAEGRRL